MAAKARVGIIGLGSWGKVLADAAKASGELELVSCFARTPESRRAFASAHGCREAASLDDLLSDPEVEGILIASSHLTHRELIEAAADAGKHVFVEKPLAPDTDDAKAAVEAARRAGISLQVGHQRRRSPANRRIRSLIDDGSIGEIQLLEANHSHHNGFKMAEEAWRWNPEESPLGSMTSLGIHKIDDFHYMGGRIARVSAFSRRGRSVTIDEATGLLFEFESGAVGTLLSSFFTAFLSRLSVHGTRGAAYMEEDGRRLTFQVPGEMTRSELPLPDVDPVVDQLAEFGRVVRGEAEPEVGGEEGLEVVVVLQTAVASVRSGKAEEVAHFRP